MRPFAAVMEHFDFAFVRHAVVVAIATIADFGIDIASVFQSVGVAVEDQGVATCPLGIAGFHACAIIAIFAVGVAAALARIRGLVAERRR